MAEKQLGKDDFEEPDDGVGEHIATSDDGKGKRTSEPWADEVDIRGDASYGPFKFYWDIYPESIKVTVYLAGVKIGSGTLTAAKNSLCVSAKFVVVKGDVCLIVDFATRELRCAGKHCYKKADTSWQCKKFNHRIAAW